MPKFPLLEFDRFRQTFTLSPASSESVMIDPICGMEVEPSKAAGNQVYDGQTYFFCSHHCLAKFKEEPEKFMKSRANGHAARGHEHGHEHVAPQTMQAD